MRRVEYLEQRDQERLGELCVVGEVGDLLARIGLLKGDNAGILQIDKELGES